jgi:hypothetical protein
MVLLSYGIIFRLRPRELPSKSFSIHLSYSTLYNLVAESIINCPVKDTVESCRLILTFRGNMLPPCSGLRCVE